MDHFHNSYAVILAGGSGTRFWPRSRNLLPKQLCKINSDQQTLIEQTLSRLDDLVPRERRIVVTHARQVEKTRSIIGDQCGLVIAEPEQKNTAAALASAALVVRNLSRSQGVENPIMFSFHADHLIDDPVHFMDALSAAKIQAELGNLVLLGIRPNSPSVAFGYVYCGENLCVGSKVVGRKVLAFKEKPDLDLAKEYCDSGEYLWNSGIFTWAVKTLLQELARYLPKTVARLESASIAWKVTEPTVWIEKKDYACLEDVSIDHALLEKSTQVAVVPSEFTWLDVGSWDAIDQCRAADDSSGNRLVGDTLLIDSENSIVNTDSHFVAAIGIKDLVVVVENGAVLVCPKDRSQEVKKVVNHLKSHGRTELL